MLSCAPMVGYCLAHLFEEESVQLSCSSVVGHSGLTLADHADPRFGFPPTARGNDVVVVELKDSQSSLDPSQGYRRLDDTYCWICGAPIVDVHCKIACKRCGFMRDCSDP